MEPTALLAFGLTLMLAVLLSEWIKRTVLSTAVMFLAAGFLVGNGGFRWLQIEVGGQTAWGFTEAALFTILFVDGADLPAHELRRAWRLPGRALLLGLPLTIGAISLAGHVLLGMTWTESLLVGAILSPTDPVFVAAILEQEAVPEQLRRLLRVESGLNDGLALPVVVILLAILGHREAPISLALVEVALGIGIGMTVPVIFFWLERRPFLGFSEEYCQLGGLSLAAVLIGVSNGLHANEFLAAFVGGVTIATMRGEFASSLHQFGRPLAEAVKLAALLVFGSMLTLPMLIAGGVPVFVFAAVTLLAARPLALFFALYGRPLSRQEWLAAAWFGPKGFASLLYGLLVFRSGVPDAMRLFQAVAVVVVISMIAHSSTDVAVARTFRSGGDEVAD